MTPNPLAPQSLREALEKIVEAMDDTGPWPIDRLVKTRTIASAALSAPEAPSETLAWLIETGDHLYWNGRSGDKSAFLDEPNEAVRFARYEDAERIRCWLLEEHATFLVSRQHKFVDAVPSVPSESDQDLLDRLYSQHGVRNPDGKDAAERIMSLRAREQQLETALREVQFHLWRTQGAGEIIDRIDALLAGKGEFWDTPEPQPSEKE